MTHGWNRAAGALLLAVAAAACSETNVSERANGSLETAVVQQGDLDIRVEAAGLVEPILVVEVKSKASGEILDMHVDTGDRIERGTLMVEIDPRDVRNALAQAQADLEVAEARVAVAQAQQRRSAELREANVVTEQEFETAALEAANARATLVKAQTNLELAQERMGDVTIRAPLSGTVIDKNVEIGQIIQSASQNVSGGTTLFLMADLSEMEVRTLVDETDIGKIEADQTAQVTVEAYPDRTFTGSVLKIEPRAVVEQNVTMFPVLVRLDNREGLLKPNMNAEVQIEVASRRDVLMVPNAAVVGMTDAAAAAAVLGLDTDALRQPMAGRAGMRQGGGRGAATSPAAAELPDATELVQPREGDPAVTAAGPETPSQETCRRLFQAVRADGRDALSEEERSQLEACRTRFAGAGVRAGATTGPETLLTSEDMRRAVLFVKGPDGPEPRLVTLGLNDWDRTEVVNGVEAGEEVVLISVARLRQQQEDMVNRIRERTGGPIPGTGRGPR